MRLVVLKPQVCWVDTQCHLALVSVVKARLALCARQRVQAAVDPQVGLQALSAKVTAAQSYSEPASMAASSTVQVRN
ncbi:hypothetical protein IU450_32830 [Nocardia abscessus]|uniref:hypothetical protein n=1 Tax=Nocardia abscessus TaxID=120957 RepID=UPI001895918C|nr:hypothetical protein [Nocardia abscessus]MBF6340647.1 hypothetical protein [Nocardia abscessus]